MLCRGGAKIAHALSRHAAGQCAIRPGFFLTRHTLQHHDRFSQQLPEILDVAALNDLKSILDDALIDIAKAFLDGLDADVAAVVNGLPTMPLPSGLRRIRSRGSQQHGWQGAVGVVLGHRKKRPRRATWRTVPFWWPNCLFSGQPHTPALQAHRPA